MKKKSLRAMLCAAMLLFTAILPVWARADVTFSLGAFNPTTRKYDSATGGGSNLYKSLVVNYSYSIEGDESIQLPSSVSGFVLNSASSNNYSKVVNIPDGKKADEIAAYVRQIVFNGGSAGQQVNISLGAEEINNKTFYWSGNNHYYQFVPYSQSQGQDTSWITARNQAMQMHYNGRTGYLATIASAEENEFVYSVSHSLGWLGGTRLVRVDSSLDWRSWTFYPQAEHVSSDYWYWACGPEAGERFYNKAVRTETSDAENTGYYYNWDSPEPNDYGNSESCLVTLSSFDSTWNDIHEDGYGNGGATSKGYFVEFGNLRDGDNTVVGPEDAFAVEAAVAASLPAWATNAGLSPSNAEWTGRDSNGVPLTTPILKLTANATLTGTLRLPAGSNVSLNLNGKTLTAPTGTSAVTAASGVVKLAITGSGSILGGKGADSGSSSGTGSAGAAGINFSNAFAGSTVTVGSGVTVRGGNGGNATGLNSTGGAGGLALSGSNVSLTNNGVLRGGDGGNATRTVGTGGRAITGAYTESSSYVTGSNGTLLTFTVTALPASLNFGSKSQGYTGANLPGAQTVTVTNTGNQPITLNAPSEISTAYYTITTPSGWGNALLPNSTRQFTVRPKEGLLQGSRNATISVTTAQGSSASVAASFTVNTPLTARIESNPGLTIIAGGSTTLTAKVSGGTSGTTRSFVWTKVGDPTVLSYADTLTVGSTHPLAAQTNTTYQVTVTEAGHASASATAVVTVNPQTYTVQVSPQTNDFGSKSKHYLFLPGKKTITVTNVGNSPVNLKSLTGSTAFAIATPSNWTGSLGPGSTRTFTIQPNSGLDTGTYNESFSVETTQGTSANVGAKFVVNSAMNVSITGDPSLTIIAGNSTKLKANITGGTSGASYNYEWTITAPSASASTVPFATSNPVTVSPTVMTTYQVKVMEVNNSNALATATVTVIPATYTIALSETSHDFGDVAVGYLTAPAEKSFTITNNGNSPITGFGVAGTGSDYIVKYTSGTISANGGQASFSIQPKTGLGLGTHADTFTVSTTPSQATNPTVTVTMDVNNTPAVAPPASAEPVYVTVVKGAHAVFKVTATGTDPLAYQWYRDVNDGSGFLPIDSVLNATAATDSYLTASTTLQNSGYRYYCVVTNTVGRADSGVFILNVVEPGVPNTGDGSMPLLWACLALVTGLGLVLLVKKRSA